MLFSLATACRANLRCSNLNAPKSQGQFSQELFMQSIENGLIKYNIKMIKGGGLFPFICVKNFPLLSKFLFLFLGSVAIS
jgi:hypothetical protein